MLVYAGNLQYGDCLVHSQKKLLVLKVDGLAGNGYIITVAHADYEEIFRIQATGDTTFTVIKRLGEYLK